MVIESIQVHTPAQNVSNRIVLTALEGSHIYAALDNTGAISVPMKGGFSFAAILTGFTIQYRIHKYQS